MILFTDIENSDAKLLKIDKKSHKGIDKIMDMSQRKKLVIV